MLPDEASPPLTQKPPPVGSNAGSFLLRAAAIVALMTFAIVLGGREVNWGSRHVIFRDEGGTAAALAQRAVESGVAAVVNEDELHAIVEALKKRAAEGDPRAALVVFEIAKLQKDSRSNP